MAVLLQNRILFAEEPNISESWLPLFRMRFSLFLLQGQVLQYLPEELQIFAGWLLRFRYYLLNLFWLLMPVCFPQDWKFRSRWIGDCNCNHHYSNLFSATCRLKFPAVLTWPDLHPDGLYCYAEWYHWTALTLCAE